MRSLPILLLTGALACAPASTSTDTAADHQAIRAAMESIQQAITTQADSVIATFYADSAVMMPPGSPRVVGRERIREVWAAAWPLKATLSMTPATIQVSGDRGVVEGTWTWSQPIADGVMEDGGKRLDAWSRIDGNWKLSYEIWNSDGALPPAATSDAPRN